jgi:hypothetical protein
VRRLSPMTGTPASGPPAAQPIVGRVRRDGAPSRHDPHRVAAVAAPR